MVVHVWNPNVWEAEKEEHGKSKDSLGYIVSSRQASETFYQK